MAFSSRPGSSTPTCPRKMNCGLEFVVGIIHSAPLSSTCYTLGKDLQMKSWHDFCCTHTPQVYSVIHGDFSKRLMGSRSKFWNIAHGHQLKPHSAMRLLPFKKSPQDLYKVQKVAVWSEAASFYAVLTILEFSGQTGLKLAAIFPLLFSRYWD